jgi:peptidoglycan hydrolase-like protein with peptidoglycan-binding domain
MLNKSKTAKFLAGFVAFAFVVTMVATPVSTKAQTTAELQAMINSLLAQIAALQGQVGGGVSTSHTFTTDLTIGSQGADVTALQQFLVSKGFLTMPAGVSMGYFGSLTQSALANYQAANGISPASGYFGPITRANVNSMMTPTTPTTPTTPGTGSSGLQGGAGDITVTERSSGVEDEILEGSEEVKILGFEVEAEGSDIAVTSVRVEFEHDGAGSDRLSRYVDEVFVMMDGRIVGSADARDFNESSDVYSRNIPVNGAVIDEDETERFHIAISAVGNIDSDDLGENWEVAIGQIRFNDATGAILTDNTGTGVNGSITETFSFEDLSSSGDVELTINEDDNSINDAHTVAVDDTSDTNGVEILSFTLEADGSDIYLDTLSFGVTSNSGTGVTEIANDFRLMMDGQEVGNVTLDKDCDGGSDGFASTTDEAVCIVVNDLDDDDVVIEEGDEVSFVLEADINDIDGGFAEGDTLSVSFNGDATLSSNGHVDADDENGDSLTANELSGSATSGPIDFMSTGVMVTVTSTPSPTQITNLPDDSTDNQGEFVMEFEVTAFEDTSWVALTAGSSTDAAGDDLGVAFSMENASTGAAAQSGTTTAILARVSGGTVSGNFVRINSGQTAKFRLTVYHDPAATAIYRVQMNEVGFNQSSAAVADDAKPLTPATDYESASIQIQN